MDPTWVAVAEGLDAGTAQRARDLLAGQEIRCTAEGGRILVPPADSEDARIVLSALQEEGDLGGGEQEPVTDEAKLTAPVNDQRLPGLAADALVMALRSVGIPAKTDGPGASRGSEIGLMPEVRVMVAPEDLDAARHLYEHLPHTPAPSAPPDLPKAREDTFLGASLGTEPPTGPSSLTLLALFAILAIVAVVVMKACT